MTLLSALKVAQKGLGKWVFHLDEIGVDGDGVAHIKEAAAALARLEEMEPAKEASVLSCETPMGCAMGFEKEWTDRYGDVFRDAVKNYRDWCRVSTKVRPDAAPKEGS